MIALAIIGCSVSFLAFAGTIAVGLLKLGGIAENIARIIPLVERHEKQLTVLETESRMRANGTGKHDALG